MKNSFTTIITIVACAFCELPTTILLELHSLNPSTLEPFAGMHKVSVKIFSTSDAPEPIWQETHNRVFFQDGFAEIELGLLNPFPRSLDFSKLNWIQIIIDDIALEPRLQMCAIPESYVKDMPGIKSFKFNSLVNRWDLAEGEVPVVVPAGGGVIFAPGDTACVMWTKKMGVLYTAKDANCTEAYLGIARGDCHNMLWGNKDSTHINFGVACTTGNSGSTTTHCAVGGGYRNIAGASSAVVCGGSYNNSAGIYAAVVGGSYGRASGSWSFAGGGYADTASAASAAVAGGQGNKAGNTYSFVGGGYRNKCDGSNGVICGGTDNIIISNASNSAIVGGYADTVSGVFSFVGGGKHNVAGDANADTSIFIGGGKDNTVLEKYSSLVGGESNRIESRHSFFGTGLGDTIKGNMSVICGGKNNIVGNASSDSCSFIGGGSRNKIFSRFGTICGGSNNLIDVNDVIYATICGGESNRVYDRYGTICGGMSNEANNLSFIGGGKKNSAGELGAIAGGDSNIVKSYYGGILGGYWNIAGDSLGDSAIFIGGGKLNHASGDYTVIGGGKGNIVEGNYSAILTGESNEVKGISSFAFGRKVRVSSSYVAAFYTDTIPGKLSINNPNPHSTLHDKGSFATAYRNISEPYTTNSDTLKDTDFSVFVNIDNNDTIMIVSPASCGGRIYFIRNTSTANTIFLRSVAYQIDSAPYISLHPNEGVIIQSNGIDRWWRIASFP